MRKTEIVEKRKIDNLKSVLRVEIGSSTTSRHKGGGGALVAQGKENVSKNIFDVPILKLIQCTF